MAKNDSFIEGNINTDAMSTLQTIIIIITLVIFFGRMFFGVFKRFSPFSHAGSDEQADFNVSDYNIVNLEIDTSNNTDNDTNNRIGINSSSDAEIPNGATSSAEESQTSPSSPKETIEITREETNKELNKTDRGSKSSRIIVHQSVCIINNEKKELLL